MIKLRDDLEFDPSWTAEEIEKHWLSQGHRVNIAVKSKIIMDCGNNGEYDGFKIHLDRPYPDGKIELVEAFTEITNGSIVNRGIVYDRSNQE